MRDREDIIKALELEAKHPNDWECKTECPYYGKTECDCYEQVYRDALELIKVQEAAIDDLKGFINGFSKNAVPVVWCKECKHATMTTDGKFCKYCDLCTDDDGYLIEQYNDADWFCPNGERK